MAYSAKERQNEIGLVRKNSRGEYIRVARVIPEDSKKLESLDIRLMYTAEDGSIKHTTKGIRVNSELLPEVVSLIIKGMSQEELDELEVMLSDEGISFTRDYDNDSDADSSDDEDDI